MGGWAGGWAVGRPAGGNEAKLSFIGVQTADHVYIVVKLTKPTGYLRVNV